MRREQQTACCQTQRGEHSHFILCSHLSSTSYSSRKFILTVQNWQIFLYTFRQRSKSKDDQNIDEDNLNHTVSTYIIELIQHMNTKSIDGKMYVIIRVTNCSNRHMPVPTLFYCFSQLETDQIKKNKHADRCFFPKPLFQNIVWVSRPCCYYGEMPIGIRCQHWHAPVSLQPQWSDFCRSQSLYLTLCNPVAVQYLNCIHLSIQFLQGFFCPWLLLLVVPTDSSLIKWHCVKSQCKVAQIQKHLISLEYIM